MSSAASGAPSLPAARPPAPTTLTIEGLTYSDTMRINNSEHDVIFSNGPITVVFTHKRMENGRPFAGGVEIPRKVSHIRLLKNRYIWKVYYPSDYREGTLDSIYTKFYKAWMGGEETRRNFSFTFNWTPAPRGGRRRKTRGSKRKGSRKVKR
jgi:hypothetical protein